jgi:sentrin-specific protease 1
MLDEREQHLRLHNPRRRQVVFVDTLFLARLLNEGGSVDASTKDVPTPQYCYDKVSTWFINEREKRKKSIDIFSVDRIFIPVNTNNNHWALIVLHMHRKEMRYYDSMTGSHGRGHHVKDMLKRWMVDEAEAKKGTSDFVEADKWDIKFETCPKQTNGRDCGVFTIMYADFLVDHLPLIFRQDDIVKFRQKITADILRGYLTY